MAKDYEGKNIADIDELPLLPLIDITMFPFMILPLFVGRKSSIEAVEHALEKSGRMIMLSGQKNCIHKRYAEYNGYLPDGYCGLNHAHEEIARWPH